MLRERLVNPSQLERGVGAAGKAPVDRVQVFACASLNIRRRLFRPSVSFDRWLEVCAPSRGLSEGFDGLRSGRRVEKHCNGHVAVYVSP